MKRFLLLFFSIALAVSLFLCTQQDKESNTGEFAGIVLKTVKPFNYVGLRHTGPYEDHEAVIQKFQELAEEQGLEVSGPMMGFYYNSPDEVPPEKLEWMVAFEIEDTSGVERPLVTGTWNRKKVVSYMHHGSPQEVSPAYQKIQKYLLARKMNKNGPAVERFMNPHSASLPPESLRTEIWFPVEK